jgi:hypothetical protein
MAENEVGIVSTAQAVRLLALETPAELSKLARAGWIKQEGADRWQLVLLVHGYVRYLKWTANVATTAQLAACWSVTKQRVGQLVAEGWFKPLDGHRGLFNWMDANSGHARYMRDEGRRTTKSAAESRVRDARAEEILLRVGLRSGDLMEHAEHTAIIDEVVGLFRSELSGLPARLTRDLQERGRIEQVVYDILERISARAAEAARNDPVARSGGDKADADDNARSVGG